MSPASARERFDGLSEAATFGLVVLAVLAFAFVFTYPRQWTRGLLINDEMWYAHLARSAHQGEGYVTNTIYPMQFSEVDSFPAPEAFKQAGYPLMTAAAWTLTGESPRAMVAVALLGFALAAGLIYLLGRAAGWGRSASLFLVGVIAFSTSVVVPLTAALPESWYLALFLGTLLLLLRGTPASVAGSGLAQAALLVVKGHAILYVPVFPGWLLLTGGRDRWRRAGLWAGSLAVGLAAATLLLPAGSVQLFESGGNYSLAFLIDTDRAPAHRLPYHEIDPPDAAEYILDHPAEYAEKYLRMVSRTKVILEGLGGPALGGVLFFLLGASLLLLVADLLRPGWILPRAGGAAGTGPVAGDEGGSGAAEPPPAGAGEAARAGAEAPPAGTGDAPAGTGDAGGDSGATDAGEGALARGIPDRRALHLLFLAVLAVTFAFFWGVHLTARFVMHTYPLMLLLVFEVAARFRRLAAPMEPRLRATLVALAVTCAVVYPAATSLWQSYRDPFAHLGRQLAVRFVDYEEMAEDVRGLPPGPVVSDMGHEIEWFTGRPTIMFPLDEDDLRALVEKYDVVALYEHPINARDWPWMRTAFRLADDTNGRLWVRRGSAFFIGER